MTEITEKDILFVLGPSNSGKTSSIELIIKDMESLGFTIGYIKYTHKEVISEVPTKDTARVRRAGSKYSLFLTPLETSFILKKRERDKIEHILEILNEPGTIIPKTELIICESLNNPPDGSSILLVGSEENELDEYTKHIINPNILAVTGKISNSKIKSWKNHPIFNSLDSKARKNLVNILANHFAKLP